MNTKKYISWLLLLFGEALIIAAFILFSGSLADNILVLNIVVSTVIYGLFFVDILVPWIDFKDKSQQRVGSMGVRWFVTWFYAIAAIAVMLVGNIVLGWTFATQLIIHGGLLLFLFLGLLAASHASDKVNQVYQIEKANRSGIVEMKKAMVSLKDKINDTPELPDYFVKRVNTLEEGLRFLSPTDNSEAYELENEIVGAFNAIRIALNDYAMNKEQIDRNLNKCDRLYQNRKNVYSN